MNHLLNGGIIGLENKYIYMENSNNIKALIKYKIEDNTKGLTGLEHDFIIDLLGFYEEDYFYELVNYNGLTINYFIRTINSNNEMYLKFL